MYNQYRQSSPTRFPTVEQAFGAALLMARLERGYTQVDLSAISTVNQSFISQLERGKRIVGLLQFMQLALALGMSPEELTRRTVERLEVRAYRRLLEVRT